MKILCTVKASDVFPLWVYLLAVCGRNTICSCFLFLFYSSVVLLFYYTVHCCFRVVLFHDLGVIMWLSSYTFFVIVASVSVGLVTPLVVPLVIRNALTQATLNLCFLFVLYVLYFYAVFNVLTRFLFCGFAVSHYLVYASIKQNRYASCGSKWHGLSLLDYAFLAELAYFDQHDSEVFFTTHLR